MSRIDADHGHARGRGRAGQRLAGLIAAVRAPLRRKLRALAVSLPVIYGLNLLRNVFISIGFGEQLFQIFRSFGERLEIPPKDKTPLDVALTVLGEPP
jgi:hypothetical protein